VLRCGKEGAPSPRTGIEDGKHDINRTSD